MKVGLGAILKSIIAAPLVVVLVLNGKITHAAKMTEQECAMIDKISNRSESLIARIESVMVGTSAMNIAIPREVFENLPYGRDYIEHNSYTIHQQLINGEFDRSKIYRALCSQGSEVSDEYCDVIKTDENEESTALILFINFINKNLEVGTEWRKTNYKYGTEWVMRWQYAGQLAQHYQHNLTLFRSIATQICQRRTLNR